MSVATSKLDGITCTSHRLRAPKCGLQYACTDYFVPCTGYCYAVRTMVLVCKLLVHPPVLKHILSSLSLEFRLYNIIHDTLTFTRHFSVLTSLSCQPGMYPCLCLLVYLYIEVGCVTLYICWTFHSNSLGEGLHVRETISANVIFYGIPPRYEQMVFRMN